MRLVVVSGDLLHKCESIQSVRGSVLIISVVYHWRKQVGPVLCCRLLPWMLLRCQCIIYRLMLGWNLSPPCTNTEQPNSILVGKHLKVVERECAILSSYVPTPRNTGVRPFVAEATNEDPACPRSLASLHQTWLATV